MYRKLTSAAIGGAVVAVAVATSAFALDPWDRMHRRDHPWAGALLLCLIGALAVAALVVALVGRRPAPHPSQAQQAPTAAPPSPTANAEALLADRLARGEITPDDYRTLLATLRGG
jgi:putative membrane protein